MSSGFQWKGRLPKAISKKGKQGEMTEQCQIIQELE